MKIDLAGYRLYFLPDACFSDLAAAVADGHEFQLLVTNGSHQYMEYAVVFTTLPVMRIDGSPSYVNEDGREVSDGKMCLWTPLDPDLGRSSVKSSELEWHIRGISSAGLNKSPWKLSLKKNNNQNRNLSLAGLGADDDWILNPMNMDDTKLKEKLFMDLWNKMAEQTDWDLKMSSGEYVEVVMNHDYRGVYLLQRRVDEKYLSLAKNDILLKGRQTWEMAPPQNMYEIISSPLDDVDTYALMEGLCNGEDYSIIQPDNYIDVNLFIQYASAADNSGVKNMFYALRCQDRSYTLCMIPWDTDMAFGVTWQDGFVYDYDKSIEEIFSRWELAAMQEWYPELNARSAARWNFLRGNVLSTENVLSVLQHAESQLESSGARLRDKQRWGEFYSGADTVQMLSRYAEEKLLRLDAYYAQ